MRKPAFCKCESKGAEQYNRAADQLICFRFIYCKITLLPINPKFQASRHILWLQRPVCVGLFMNPGDRVYCDATQFILDAAVVIFCLHRNKAAVENENWYS